MNFISPLIKNWFYNRSPYTQHKIRKAMLRIGLRKTFGIHQYHAIHKTAVLENRDIIQIDSTAVIAEYCILRTLSQPIRIGARSAIGPFTVIYGGAGVTIGEDVMIAPHVVLVAGSHDYAQTKVPMNVTLGLTKGPIIIEDDVWVGANCTVCDGVTLGRGSVIGAGAVVIKSTEPYGIYGGIPAKQIGSRHDEKPEAEIWRQRGRELFGDNGRNNST